MTASILLLAPGAGTDARDSVGCETVAVAAVAFVASDGVNADVDATGAARLGTFVYIDAVVTVVVQSESVETGTGIVASGVGALMHAASVLELTFVVVETYFSASVKSVFAFASERLPR